MFDTRKRLFTCTAMRSEYAAYKRTTPLFSLLSYNYDYRSAHVCVGGALPRVGDRGNRRKGREGRGSPKSGRRKEGRTDLEVEKWTKGWIREEEKEASGDERGG